MVLDISGNTQLLHVTLRDNLDSIMEHGLRPNGMKFIYLSPLGQRDVIESRLKPDQVLLLVETGDRPLGYFEDCEEWERLCNCNEPIPPSDIIVLKEGAL